MIKFRWRSASSSVYRDCFPDSSLLGDTVVNGSGVNNDLGHKAKAKAKAKDLDPKAKTKDLGPKAKVKAKDLSAKAKDLGSKTNDS